MNPLRGLTRPRDAPEVSSRLRPPIWLQANPLLFSIVPSEACGVVLAHFLNELSRLLGNGREVAWFDCGDRELEAMNCKFRKRIPQPTCSLFPPPGMDRGSATSQFLLTGATSRRRVGPSGEDESEIPLQEMPHLAGFDHATDRGEMARRSGACPRKFGPPMALIERARGPA